MNLNATWHRYLDKSLNRPPVGLSCSHAVAFRECIDSILGISVPADRLVVDPTGQRIEYRVYNRHDTTKEAAFVSLSHSCWKELYCG